jgi:hypothetical protein
LTKCFTLWLFLLDILSWKRKSTPFVNHSLETNLIFLKHFMKHSLSFKKQKRISKKSLVSPFSLIIFLIDELMYTTKILEDHLQEFHKSTGINGHSLLLTYKQYLKKTRSTFSTLNKLKLDRGIYFGLFWIPKKHCS